jgi:serine/threonine-protein kinase HipA
LALAGEGRGPGLPHIRQVARGAGLAARDADGIYEQVRAVIARWPEFAHQAGVAERRVRDIGCVLNPG